MNIELTKDDVEFLHLLLEREYRSTLVEMHHTKDRKFRSLVKEKEEHLENLIERLTH